MRGEYMLLLPALTWIVSVVAWIFLLLAAWRMVKAMESIDFTQREQIAPGLDEMKRSLTRREP